MHIHLTAEVRDSDACGPEALLIWTTEALFHQHPGFLHLPWRWRLLRMPEKSRLLLRQGPDLPAGVSATPKDVQFGANEVSMRTDLDLLVVRLATKNIRAPVENALHGIQQAGG